MASRTRDTDHGDEVDPGWCCVPWYSSNLRCDKVQDRRFDTSRRCRASPTQDATRKTVETSSEEHPFGGQRHGLMLVQRIGMASTVLQTAVCHASVRALSRGMRWTVGPGVVTRPAQARSAGDTARGRHLLQRGAARLIQQSCAQARPRTVRHRTGRAGSLVPIVVSTVPPSSSRLQDGVSRAAITSTVVGERVRF
jgi:hypothetical protein